MIQYVTEAKGFHVNIRNLAGQASTYTVTQNDACSTTSNKELLGTKGLATRNKDAISSSWHYY